MDCRSEAAGPRQQRAVLVSGAESRGHARAWLSLFLAVHKRSCARPVWRLSVCRVFSGAALGAGRLAGNAGRGDRWLFARVPPLPSGITLAAGEALRFRRVVARLCEQLEVPMVDHVLISEDLNAALVTRVRAMVCGGRWNRCWLWGCRCCRVSIRVSCTRFWPTRLLTWGVSASARRPGAHFRAWWLRVVDRIESSPDAISRIVAIPLRRLSDRFVWSLLELSYLEGVRGGCGRSRHGRRRSARRGLDRGRPEGPDPPRCLLAGGFDR